MTSVSPPPEIRPARPADLDAVMRLCHALWPDEPSEEVRAHMQATVTGEPRSTLPLTVLLALRDGEVIGFIEVGLRSHADSCDGTREVGYIEGWFVAPEHRGTGVGRALMTAAEGWCRRQGCTELASDTWLDNEPSQKAHVALGFAIVERVVLFRKPLPS
jgi:aminoglycoside 6'-N-acetyltransferase I